MTFLISSWMLITIGNCHRSPVTSLSMTDIYILLITSLASLSTYPAAITYDQGHCPVPAWLSYKAMTRARLFCKTKSVTNWKNIKNNLWWQTTIQLYHNVRWASGADPCLPWAKRWSSLAVSYPNDPASHVTWQETSRVSLPRCATVGTAIKDIRQSWNPEIDIHKHLRTCCRGRNYFTHAEVQGLQDKGLQHCGVWTTAQVQRCCPGFGWDSYFSS